jgi:hypothetical protein
MIYERGGNTGERWRLHLHKRWGDHGFTVFLRGGCMGVGGLLVCVFVVYGFPAVSIPYVRIWKVK